MFSLVHFAGVIFILIGLLLVAATAKPMCKDDPWVAMLMAIMMCSFILIGQRLLLM